jgi:hypothetical protein
MRAHIVATEAFRYTAEIRKLDRPDCGYSFSIASTWLGAKDPTAMQPVLQITPHAEGLLALRDLIEAEVQS